MGWATKLHARMRARMSGGADISALIGLARPFVRELVCVFVALDADVGRDPFHVDMVVGEGGSIELPDSAS